MPQILTMHSFIGCLRQQMVDEGWDPNQDVRFIFADMTQIAFSAHHFSATRTQSHYATLGAGIMSQPEGEVRRKGQGVEQTIFASGGADLNDAPGGRSEIGDIMLCEQERRRFGAAACRERHENGPEFGFKLAPDLFPSMQQRAKDCSRAMRQNF